MLGNVSRRRLALELLMALSLTALFTGFGVITVLRTTTFVNSSMVLVPMSDLDLAREADTIVLADVRGQATRVAGVRHGVPSVFTDSKVDVIRVLKGSPASSLTVTTSGGSASGVIERNADEASISTGDRVVLFLSTAPTGETVVVGGIQGRYYVTGDSVSNEVHHGTLQGLIATVEASR
ncbi:MAG TPA: hypothetical protein VI814_02700 [Candidatus Limnocylindria bacterium]